MKCIKNTMMTLPHKWIKRSQNIKYKIFIIYRYRYRYHKDHNLFNLVCLLESNPTSNKLKYHFYFK